MSRLTARSLSLTSQESYSAVIIADMVAEVATQIDHQEKEGSRKNSLKSVKSHDGKNSINKKDEVNLGYDGHPDITPPAVVNVDTMETINLGPAIANGTDISKGVILNAQFGPLDSKVEYNGAGKSIEMNSHPLPVADIKKEAKSQVVSEFSQMSIPRKIAFVFSFLPSIMFVLCFAVILPCEKKLPCVQEMWTRTLNDTDVTTGLTVSSERLFYSYSQNGGNPRGLISLELDSGNDAWMKTVNYDPRLIDCTKLVENASDTCLVTESSGAIHLLNASSGNPILSVDLTPKDGGSFSAPVTLPDCLGNGISEIGVAVSNKQIKVIYMGFIMSNVSIHGCESIPDKLTSWTRKDGKTDLIFTCQSGSKDQLVSMSQNSWCTYNKKETEKGKPTILHTGAKDSLKKAVLRPTPEGLITWIDDQVSLYGLNGQKNWSVSSQPHFSKNRFLVYGKFEEPGTQIALFSSDISSKLLITMLNLETGEATWNKTVSNAEISDVSVIKGEKKDFVLVFMKKLERDLKTEAVTHLSEVPSTLASLLSEEALVGRMNSSASVLVEEVTFMELGGSFYQTVEENKIPSSEGESYKASLSAVPWKDKEIAIVILKQSKTQFPHTQLKSINVGNWDISLTENRQCVWKS